MHINTANGGLNLLSLISSQADLVHYSQSPRLLVLIKHYRFNSTINIRKSPLRLVVCVNVWVALQKIVPLLVVRNTLEPERQIY